MIRTWLLGLSVLALAGCEAPRQDAKPTPPTVTTPTPDAKPSDRSIRLQAFYAGFQARMRASGKMRTERTPADAPFSAAQLVRNFTDIALFDEYIEVNGRFIQRKTPSSLRRWEEPIRIGLVFSDTMSEKNKARDTREVRRFTAKLSRLTGVPMQLTAVEDANMTLLFLNHDDQRAADKYANTVPNFIAPIRADIKITPRNVFCVAYPMADGTRGDAYRGAIIMIKAEHPDAMRTSCIEEEMAQAMGLANDSPQARPSIFNDDEEFATLTRHDELLLQILYDKRLRLGMKPATAEPIVRKIVAELLGGSV